MWEPGSYACPHCVGVTAGCCVCGGRGRLATMGGLGRALAWSWARVGCGCPACKLAGPPPVQEARS